MDEKELAAFVDNEELEINKDVNTVSEGPTLKVEKNLMEMTTEEIKVEKKMVPVYLEEEGLDKIKTVGYYKNKSVAAILEEVLIDLTKGIEVDEKAVKKYNKMKGNRGKKKK